MLFVYQGSADQGPMFFDEHIGDVEAIADPDGALYAALDVRRGGVREMFGFRAWMRGLRAVTKGHFVNRKIGDPWTLPTIVALRDRQIVWEHRGTYAGDHPEVGAIPGLVEAGS